MLCDFFCFFFFLTWWIFAYCAIRWFFFSSPRGKWIKQAPNSFYSFIHDVYNDSIKHPAQYFLISRQLTLKSYIKPKVINRLPLDFSDLLGSGKLYTIGDRFSLPQPLALYHPRPPFFAFPLFLPTSFPLSFSLSPPTPPLPFLFIFLSLLFTSTIFKSLFYRRFFSCDRPNDKAQTRGRTVHLFVVFVFFFF